MITREQLAKELGVSRATVSKNEARGMPVDDVTSARRWRKKKLQHGRMKGVRRDTLAGDGVQTPAPVPIQIDDGDDCNDIDPEDKQIRSYQGARDRREHYQAELARLSYEREAGLLMVSTEVIKAMTEAATHMRLTLEAMPYRLSPILVEMSDEYAVTALLKREVFNVLTAMSYEFEKLASKQLVNRKNSDRHLQDEFAVPSEDDAG